MHTGGCHCGQVRYESRGTPRFALICYCRDCQRASGTAGVPVLGVSMAEFIVTGATRTTESLGSSGKRGIRHFCATCGSLLFGTPEVAPDLVTVYAGSLDTLEAFTPTMAIFTRSRPAWAALAQPLTEYEGAPT
ncbi:MAG: GFA family protein [Gammaproteobacteria bacterium]|nr:GFA family protein [Gammaproteobacteria bacterium]